MGPAEILEALARLGVSARAEEGKLRLEPGSRVPPELLAAVRRQKAAIVNLLEGERAAARLLAWASRMAELGQPLALPARFSESPARPVVLQDSAMLRRYVKEKLAFLGLARHYRDSGGPGHFPPQWWRDREQETLAALAALQAALVSDSMTAIDSQSDEAHP